MIVVDGYVFKGHYASLCADFIKYKKSIGYKYGARTIRQALYMNNYLASCPFREEDGDYTLDKEIVIAYVAKRDSETSATQMQREIRIRQFAIYLNSLGISAYIAPAVQKGISAFTPYIFTREQMAAILNITDHLEYEYRSPHYHHVYPFMIRLLYCCGLRISEAVSLRIEDIDFDEKLLHIEQAKYNNSRLIPMSESLYLSLVKYMGQVGYSKNHTGYLFRTKWDTPYNPHSIYSRFKDFLQMANIPCTENGGLPRLHDIPPHFRSSLS